MSILFKLEFRDILNAFNINRILRVAAQKSDQIFIQFEEVLLSISHLLDIITILFDPRKQELYHLSQQKLFFLHQ